MKNEPSKKQPAESEEDLASMLSEETLSENPMQDEIVPSEPEKSGFFHRVAQRLEKRESAARQKRLASEGRAAPDRTSIMLAAIPFWAVAGTTLKNGVALCAVLLITLIPASFLRDILRRRLGLEEWLALPLSVLVATMLASGCCALLSIVEPSLYDALGIYLFLLVAAPILMNTECYGTPERAGQFWRRTFRFILDFCIVMLLSSALREVFGYNAILGVPLSFMGKVRLEAVRQPFFGLIFAGFLLAAIRSLQSLLHKGLHRRRAAEAEKEVGAEA